MKNGRTKLDLTLVLMVIAVALAAATVSAFAWFGTTAGIALAVACAVATVISVVLYAANVRRNRDEQTRKSTYQFNWFAFVVAAIAAAAVVFLVAIFFAPINNWWMLVPGTALVADALVLAIRKDKKYAIMALAMIALIVGTNAVNYGIMKTDGELLAGGGTVEQNIYNGDVVQHADVVTPTGDVVVENAENLNAENVKAENLNVTNATIKKVEATEVKITEAKIEKVEATEVNITNANINTMNATEVNITNANIENLNATNVNIENATIAPTEPTTKAPAPTEPTTKAPAPTEPTTKAPAPTEPTTKAPETTKPTKNPTIKISSTIIEEGGRIIVTLKDAEASDVWFAYTGENGRTSEGLSLRHIAGNQYDIVVNSSLYEYSKSVNIGVNGGNICSFVIQAA